jgi:hypothetical protein
MLSLKDSSELDDYTYKVCELSGCDSEATEFYESDKMAVDLCYSHFHHILNTEYTY